MIETVGIIGGGQLGRMLTQAAKPLGFEVAVIDPNNSSECPAAQVGAEHIQAALTDEDAIRRLAQRSDVLTWEIEHIPARLLLELHGDGFNIQPHPHTLVTIQDKLEQKRLLVASGIPTAQELTAQELDEGPFILKQRKGGFDGRGNLIVDSIDDPKVIKQFGDTPVFAERLVDFDKEVSLIFARDVNGKVVRYPLVETIHRDSICHVVLAPADISDAVRSAAQEVGQETMKLLHGAGVFAIEMFVAGEDVLVNEIAPRVHNSGHHTIEANVTSQFEQHIRAVTGMPLGSVEQRSAAAVMINVLGTHIGSLDRTGLDRLLALPDAHIHLYGKSPRLARKVGHITVLNDSITGARQLAEQARKELAI